MNFSNLGDAVTVVGNITPTPSTNTNFIFNGQKSNNDSNTPSNTSIYFNSNYLLQNLPRFTNNNSLLINPNDESADNLPSF